MQEIGLFFTIKCVREIIFDIRGRVVYLSTLFPHTFTHIRTIDPFGQKHSRLARLARFAMLLVSSYPTLAFFVHRTRQGLGQLTAAAAIHLVLFARTHQNNAKRRNHPCGWFLLLRCPNKIEPLQGYVQTDANPLYFEDFFPQSNLPMSTYRDFHFFYHSLYESQLRSSNRCKTIRSFSDVMRMHLWS